MARASIRVNTVARVVDIGEMVGGSGVDNVLIAITVSQRVSYSGRTHTIQEGRRQTLSCSPGKTIVVCMTCVLIGSG